MDNTLNKCESCAQIKITAKPAANNNEWPLEARVLLECVAIILLMLNVLWLN